MMEGGLDRQWVWGTIGWKRWTQRMCGVEKMDTGCMGWTRWTQDVWCGQDGHRMHGVDKMDTGCVGWTRWTQDVWGGQDGYRMHVVNKMDTEDPLGGQDGYRRKLTGGKTGKLTKLGIGDRVNDRVKKSWFWITDDLRWC